MRFRHFLLNENAVYLGQRVGDILNAIADLKENSKGMGTRQATAAAENIANQIRNILHANWGKEVLPQLKTLQKAGVAIMRAIEDKSEDMAPTLAAVEVELQKLTSDMGTPINTLGTPESQSPEAPPSVQPSAGEQPNEEQPKEPPPQPQGAPNPQQPEQPLQAPAAVGTPPQQGPPTSGPARPYDV